VNNFELETCQKAATYLKKLSSVRFSSVVKQGQDFDVENAVQCMLAFLNTGKLRSVSLKISAEGTDFKMPQLWRENLRQHPEVKKWSKVTRIRCELSLSCRLSNLFAQLMSGNEEP